MSLFSTSPVYQHRNTVFYTTINKQIPILYSKCILTKWGHEAENEYYLHRFIHWTMWTRGPSIVLTMLKWVLDNRLPGLLLQTAFYRCCETTRVHFMVLGCVNRTALGTKLLLTAVWASPVDCISSRNFLKAQHCSLGPNGCFTQPSAPHPPPLPPQPPSNRPPIPYRLNPWYYRNWKKLSLKPAAFE